MKKSDLDLLNYLLSENVSDEEKNRVVSKNNKKLIKSSSHLEKEKLIDYILNPNMPVGVKKIFSSYIDSLEKDEDEMYEFTKIFDEIEEYSENDLTKKYYPHSLKVVIASKLYSDKIYEVICNQNFPLEIKKLVIDSVKAPDKLSKILSLNPPKDVIDYIIDTKDSNYMIPQLLSNKETPMYIKDDIIDKKINIKNIFDICTNKYTSNLQAEKIIKRKSTILDKHIKSLSGRIALDELERTSYPECYRTKLYEKKRLSINLSVLLLTKLELLNYLNIDNDNIRNLILKWRKIGITIGAITSEDRTLLAWLKCKDVPDYTKKLMIKLNRPRIIRQIKRTDYSEISYLFMEEKTNLPEEIEDEIIKLKKEDIIRECGKRVSDGNPIQKIVIEIAMVSNPKFKSLIIKEKINEENIIEILNAGTYFTDTIEMIFSEKSELLDNIIKSHIKKNGLNFKGIGLNYKIRDKVLTKKTNIIEEYIKNINEEEKYNYLKCDETSLIIKKLIVDSLGFSKQDSSDALALINEFDVDNVIKYFNKLKEAIKLLDIDFNYFMQYGVGSTKYKNWFNEIVNTIKNDEINNFLTAKDYLFNELYDKEKIKKNEIYKINSLLEAIDLFSKCPELLKKISATNQKLTKEDKKNLLEFRQLSCNNHTINSLEELNVEVQKVYNSYIDKINDESTSIEELKDIFNNVILKDSQELLKNIGGTAGLKMLQTTNKEIPSINNLCEELLLYAKIIDIVDTTNNVLGLRNTLKTLFNSENLSNTQDMFLKFDEKVRLLFEMDSMENLTKIDDIKANKTSRSDLEEIYGKEIFDVSNKNYILYAHVVSDSENIAELINGVASSSKNFISLSPISYKGQKLYWSGRECILAYDDIKEGSFIYSSIANMGTNRAVKSNSSEVEEIKRHQRGILETSAVFKNNPETLLYREGLKPCGIILVGGKTPNKTEIMWHEKYNLPFIITQEAENSITIPEKVFTPNNNTKYESDNIEPLKNIIGLLEPNLKIIKEDDMYTGREVAIFTDAHALYEPTFAILEDIRKRGINEIYSLGDNIGFGPNPKEVIDLLDKYNVTSIAGNSEYYSTLGIEPFASYFDNEKIENQLYTDEELGSARIERLKLYKPSIDIILNNKKIALCHFANDIRWDYTVHSTWIYQNQNNDTRAKQFLYTNSNEATEAIEENIKLNMGLNKGKGYKDAKINPLFDGKIVTDYCAVIQGHVHFEMKDQLNDTNIRTLRAVAMGYNGEKANTACYYVLKEKKDGHVSMKKILVPFNKSNLICTINSSALPNKSKVLRYVGA